MQDDDSNIKPYIRAILLKQGRNFSVCELCGKTCKAEMHHNKYNNATIYDIKLVCHKCNMKTGNKLLD